MDQYQKDCADFINATILLVVIQVIFLLERRLTMYRTEPEKAEVRVVRRTHGQSLQNRM